MNNKRFIYISFFIPSCILIGFLYCIIVRILENIGVTTVIHHYNFNAIIRDDFFIKMFNLEGLISSIIPLFKLGNILLWLGGVVFISIIITNKIIHANFKKKIPILKKSFYKSIKYLCVIFLSFIIAGVVFYILASILMNCKKIAYDSSSILSWYGSGILLGMVVKIFWNSKYFWLTVVFSLVIIYVISVNYFDVVDNWVPLFDWFGYDYGFGKEMDHPLY